MQPNNRSLQITRALIFHSRTFLQPLHPLNPANASFPTLETLRTRQKASSSLPNQYVFSSKGTLEYDQLSMNEFVSGYLEFLKTQPELSSSSLLSHLQLLMDKASTYTWASVRKFHLSIHNAVQSKRMLWSDYEKIRERAQTFFTHLDLRAPSTTSPTSAFTCPPKVRQTKSCERWNYTGECPCDATQAIYKEHAVAVFATVQNTPCSIVKNVNIPSPLFLLEGRPPNSNLNDKTFPFLWPMQFAPMAEEFLIIKGREFNLTAWESYLNAYDDKIVVDFLKFGWPINCDTLIRRTTRFLTQCFRMHEQTFF